ncbi:type II secretion system protein [Fictibacillus sp. BK138]|uniref:type II secretion system protein n=1 Tax=Fictibacillus sp. BK138 TaxID=2512121 RepID=UPI0010291864|nr:type II secretion system protein [Fictibacillus sp. BK138]RZT21586.1 type IV pilus assembly protein PilA [Fictibacillus sp. BK138]
MLKLIKKHLKNEKGLTLIELLVVIVILGIIAAIAVVSIGGIINSTEEKAVVTEASQIINAAKLSHASEGASGNEWNAEELEDYLSSVDAEGWTVTLADGVYSINNHDAAAIATDTEGATTATEAEITDYLGGVEEEGSEEGDN